METRRLVLIVEYDGSRYSGFQVQSSVPTIQGEIERALMKLTGETIRVAGASRTDQGVHAKGQVVSFRTASGLKPQIFLRALNHYLPPDIGVKGAFVADDDFDVRRHALSREYRYYILNQSAISPFLRGRTYLVPKLLDAHAMNVASQTLVGTHDFVAFASGLNGWKSTVRTINQAEVVRNNDLVTFRVVANSFLPHQVRNTMGALTRVGLGKNDVGLIAEILRSRHPSTAGPTLPPYGLYLIKVDYPEGLI